MIHASNHILSYLTRYPGSFVHYHIFLLQRSISKCKPFFNTLFNQKFSFSNVKNSKLSQIVTSPRDTIISNKYNLDPDDYDKGLENLRQTLKIQLMSLPYYSENIAHSYFNLAMAEHQNVLLLEKAKEHYIAAYNIFCKINGAQSLESLNALTNYFVLRDLGNVSDSLSILEKVLEAKKAMKVNPKLLVDALNNLGVVSHELKKYEKALGFYLEALELINSFDDFDPEFSALIYFNIGCAYREKGSIPEAIEHMKISKDICAKLENTENLENRIKIELNNLK